MTDLTEKPQGNTHQKNQNGTQVLTETASSTFFLSNDAFSQIDLAEYAVEAKGDFQREGKARHEQCGAVNEQGGIQYAIKPTRAEITRCCLCQRLQCPDVFKSNSLLGHHHFLVTALTGQTEEAFVGLFLDHKQHVIAFDELFVGRVDNQVAEPDEPFWDQMLGPVLQHHQAKSVIFAHYRPNEEGGLRPIDHAVVQWLIQTFACLETQLLNYLVIGNNRDISVANI